MAAVVEQESQCCLGARRGHPVPVLDDHHDPLTVRVYLVDQASQDVALRVGTAFLNDPAQLGGHSRPGPADRLDQVQQEPDRVVVVRVDIEPASGDAVGCHLLTPLGGQCALAETGWRVDDDEPGPGVDVHQVQEALAAHERAR
ncbi:hypothetical protein [Nocardia salmonicida]|uniref:hypothetical protein n=1 Tax=Nocardia salmonicida TaxID=53431 RepID=UPI0033F94CC8